MAAVAFFALGAAWYNIFCEPWLDGIGKTMEQLDEGRRRHRRCRSSSDSSRSSSCATRSPGSCSAACSRAAGNGALTGATVAFGIVGAMLALNYGFEARGVTLWLINAGYVFVGLVITGAIIGAWQEARLED